MRKTHGLLMAALLAIGAWGLTPADGQWGWGGGMGAPAVKLDAHVWPTKATAVDYAKLQAAALVRKIDVSYRRATLAEVIADLEKRSGVRVAYAQSLGENWLFSLEAKGLTVKDVLEKVAGDGKFDLAQRAELTVLMQKADDQVLATLEKQLGNTDRWERCQAVWGLGNLADVRIYPLLAKGLADADAGVVEWTLKALGKHSRMGVVMGEPERAAVAVAVAVMKWFKEAQSKDTAGAGGRFGRGVWGMMGQPTAPDRSARLDLLGSTGRPEALAMLVEAVRGSSSSVMRSEAAAALANNRQGLQDLLTALALVEKEIVVAQAENDRIVAEMNKDVQPGQPRVITGTMPNAKVQEELMAGESLRRSILLALLDLRVPEAIVVAQEILATRQTIHWGYSFEAELISRDAQILDLGVTAQGELKTLETIYGIKEKVTAPGAGSGYSPASSTATQVASAIKILRQISDPAIAPALTKLVKDDQAFQAVADVTEYDTDFVLPVHDPDLVAALLTRIADPGTMGKLALKSLGQSHDPKVADALIQAMKSPNTDTAVGAGKALAQTRDPRALALLVGLVREARTWPDPEAEDQAALQAGKAVRSRLNPRKTLLVALLETRDPRTLTEMAALATDETLHKEVYETARKYVRSVVASAADLDQLLALVQKASAKVQREILAGSSAGVGYLWMVPAKPVATLCANDARWIALIVARVEDDEAMQMRRSKGQMVPQANTMLDALAAIIMPTAERAVLNVCKIDDEDLVKMARKALAGYEDPVANALAGK